MTGTTCSVILCKSNAVKAKKEGLKILFFTFPKDPEIRREWISKCCRADTWSAENKRVCSKHFDEEDYADSVKAKLMNTHPRKLKPSAIPSLFLPETTAEDARKREGRKKSKQRRKQNHKVREIKDSTQSVDLEFVAVDLPSTSFEPEDDISRQLYVVTKENESLRKLIMEKDKEIGILQQRVFDLEQVQAGVNGLGTICFVFKNDQESFMGNQ